MPSKRSHDNVVDDDEGEGEDNVKTIQIVSPTTEKREHFMCELCSLILKSASSLSRHKKRLYKFMCWNGILAVQNSGNISLIVDCE